jgi:hypothetical protein
MNRALPLLAVLALIGCGAKKPDAYTEANLALLDGVPVYPGAHAPRTTASGAGSVKFAGRDWTLPRTATQRVVIRWYEVALAKRGWRIGGESFGTIRAFRRGASLSVGVRGHTLEAIANSRGG